MVHLYGVISSGENFSFLGANRRFALTPSKELLESIRQFPKGTLVGFGTLNREDLREVTVDASVRSRQSGFGVECIEFPMGLDVYWDRLYEQCDISGHEVVFLEDKNILFDHNRSLIEVVRASEDHLYKKRGESEEKYHEKVVLHNERVWYAETIAKKVLEIDRTDRMLENIASSGVTVAIGSLGYTDPWFANREAIRNTYGIDFEAYSTDLPATDGGIRTMSFSRNAKPNPGIVYDRIKLERAVHSIVTGRIVDDREPDFTGTWNIMHPYEGYFEVFLNEESEPNAFNGRVEDCYGTATIKGRVDKNRTGFLKTYDLENSASDACKGTIAYACRPRGYGYYTAGEGNNAFFMTPVRMKPFDMSMKWFRLTKRINSGKLYRELFN